MAKPNKLLILEVAKTKQSLIRKASLAKVQSQPKAKAHSSRFSVRIWPSKLLQRVGGGSPLL